MQTFKQFLSEIEKLDSESWKGSEDEILQATSGQDLGKMYKAAKKLPGGSDLKYHVRKDGREIHILIFDDAAKHMKPERPRYAFSSEEFTQSTAPIVGHLMLVKHNHINGCYVAEVVSVVKSHRGQRIGLALYGIALDILGLTLLSDNSQTHDGARMWSNLKKVPGVKVFALYDPYDHDFDPEIEGSGPFVQDKQYRAAPVTVDANGALKAEDKRLEVYTDHNSHNGIRLIAKKVA